MIDYLEKFLLGGEPKLDDFRQHASCKKRPAAVRDLSFAHVNCELCEGSWLRLQAQTQHAPVQFATDLDLCSRAFEGSREELLETRKNGLIHRCRGRHSGVKLVERTDASKRTCFAMCSKASLGSVMNMSVKRPTAASKGRSGLTNRASEWRNSTLSIRCSIRLLRDL